LKKKSGGLGEKGATATLGAAGGAVDAACFGLQRGKKSEVEVGGKKKESPKAGAATNL